jgi:hypothetical protein
VTDSKYFHWNSSSSYGEKRANLGATQLDWIGMTGEKKPWAGKLLLLLSLLLDFVYWQW